MLRPLAQADACQWCRLYEGDLLRAGAVVRPLRAAAVARLALVGDYAPADDDAATAAGSSAPPPSSALTQNRVAARGYGATPLPTQPADAHSRRLTPLLFS